MAGKLSCPSKLLAKQVCQQRTLSGIVDTETILIYIQTDAYNSLYSNIAGYSVDSSTGLVKILSSSYASLQNIDFTIGGATFTLTPAEYILPQDQVTNWGGSFGSYYSLVGDIGSNSDGMDFILGQKFLENYYSVFDTSNSRVGLATRA